MAHYFFEQMKKYNYGFLLLFSFLSYAQYPSNVEIVLKKAGKNRVQLERALQYADSSKDTLKVKAMQFLIANMDIHKSSDYYWENSSQEKVAYNELSYSDFENATKALDEIKIANPGLHAKAYVTRDIETITGDFLIQNLESAFKAWNSSVIENKSFEIFCEYILPYRICEEPLQNWRPVYEQKFNWINEQIPSKGFKTTLRSVRDNYDSWFINKWGEQRKEPLPKLSALQILFRKEGPCPDIADLGVFTMRAEGIAATINVIPFWATAMGGHFTNTFFDEKIKPVNYDYGSRIFDEKLVREPAKVLRITYSKQPQTLASFEPADNIPPGILKQQNYVDVTNEFWETIDVKCHLFDDKKNQPIVYATTFNGLAWRPFWWGKINNNETTFTSICKNTVILPQYYSGGKMVPAGVPVIVKDNGSIELIPDLNQKREVKIAESEKYLKFKMGITYKLFYWNNGWQLIGTQKVNNQVANMVFANVPGNALLLFIGSDSKKLERPFVFNNDGSRTWF